VPEVALLKQSLKLLAFSYAYFQELTYCISTLERLRDVAVEDHD
jgi:hypothetical protein